MQKRELWKVVVFGLITFGIYTLYWLYKTRQEMVSKGAKIPSILLIFVPFLAIIAVAILQFLVRAMAGDASGGVPDTNIVSRLMNIISILVGMAAIVAMIPLAIYWFYKYCKAVEFVTGGRTSFGFAFWLWLLLSLLSVGFVWPALIQDGFNKISGGGPGNQIADTPYPTTYPSSTPQPPATPPQNPVY